MSQPTTWGCPRAADAPQTPEEVADRIDDSLDALLNGHRGSSRPTYAVAGTMWNDSDNDQVFWYDGTYDYQVAVNRGAPAASTSSPGTAGDTAWDDSYFYICSATDTWKRVAVATW